VASLEAYISASSSGLLRRHRDTGDPDGRQANLRRQAFEPIEAALERVSFEAIVAAYFIGYERMTFTTPSSSLIQRASKLANLVGYRRGGRKPYTLALIGSGLLMGTTSSATVASKYTVPLMHSLTRLFGSMSGTAIGPRPALLAGILPSPTGSGSAHDTSDPIEVRKLHYG